MKPLIYAAIVFSLGVACKNRNDSGVKSVGYSLDAESLKFKNSIGFIVEQKPDEENSIKEMNGGTGFIVADLGSTYVGMTNRHVWNALCTDKCYIAFSKTNDFSDWEAFQLAPYVEKTSAAKAQHIISKPNIIGSDEDPQGDYAFFQIVKNSKFDLTPLTISVDPIPERAVINVFGYPSGVYRTQDAEKIFEEITPPVLVWSRGVAMNILQDHFIGTAQSRHGNSGSPVFVWHNGTRIAVGINFGGPHTDSKQEANSPRSAHRAAVAGERNVGNLFSLIRKAHPNLDLWKKIPSMSRLDQNKIAAAGDLTSLLSGFEAVPVTVGKDDVQESGYRISADFSGDFDKNVDNLFFSGAPVKYFEQFRVDYTAKNISFLIPAPFMDSSLYFELQPSDIQVWFAGCSYVDLSGFMQVKFDKDFQEFLQDQDNPKWRAPKYRELKDFIQQFGKPESEIKRLRCTKESAIFNQWAKILLKPFEH